ncbi:ABC-three component system protein [Alkalibacter mobilis]|uniref:ABC-three component system protein n=1 Tax=Alkalibacter mobilis TaxID=2787712 RepID=UPI00189D8E5F|nr:ABC-three component system protein [Alkalibacter mobilis]MBF7097803.1 restriction endonuclease [Alkalibacter mobilis]
MSFEMLNHFPAPEKVTIMETEGDTRIPYERVKSYDDNEFELFIREWVVSLKDRYQVRGFGGAGDKGRDVVARDSAGEYIYYQCKHYNHSLRPNDMLPELGKLTYYTFTNQIPLPKEYYILAPMDIGVGLSDMIDNYSEINSTLVEKWSSTCRTKITSEPLELNPSLESYIREFDFSILRTKTMLEVIEEHKATAFYAFRFGGGLTVRRDRRVDVPSVVENYENIYIQKFLAAVSEKENVTINTIEELGVQFPRYMESLKIQRERFYSAENLKLFASQHLLQEDYFDDLTNDIYFGIYDLLDKIYPDGYTRLLDVMTQVAQIDLKHNLLSKYDLVHPQDRQGICHQLANERSEIKWTKQR